MTATKNENINPLKRGHFIVVGTGLKAISHMSTEVVGEIRRADVVFYHVTNGVTAAHIASLNRNLVDLFQYYGEEKLRKITYIQMAEVMLREVRQGRRVVGAFYGHPGIFVKAARRALAIAEKEGFETKLLPAISSIDCLFADLRIDPGLYGFQMVKAGSFLRGRASLATSGNVALLQIGSVGDPTYSFTGFKHAKKRLLFKKLIRIYGANHDSVYYLSATFPGVNPVIIKRKLENYRDPKVLESVHSGILYLPPVGLTLDEVLSSQAFGKHDAYGSFEKEAITKLKGHQLPEGYQPGMASKTMLEAMTALGRNPKVEEAFRRSPSKFMNSYPNLTNNEKAALIGRRASDLRRAAQSTDISNQGQGTPSGPAPASPTTAPTVQGAVLFFYKPESQFARLANIATPRAGEQPQQTSTRHGSFYISTLCTLYSVSVGPLAAVQASKKSSAVRARRVRRTSAAIAGQPSTQQPSLFDTLLQYVQANGQLDVLSSLFLTAWNSAASGGDTAGAANALNIWKQKILSTSNSDIQNSLFYDVASKALYVIPVSSLQTLAGNPAIASKWASNQPFAQELAPLAT